MIHRPFANEFSASAAQVRSTLAVRGGRARFLQRSDRQLAQTLCRPEYLAQLSRSASAERTGRLAAEVEQIPPDAVTSGSLNVFLVST
jgi:hypothetical protein